MCRRKTAAGAEFWIAWSISAAQSGTTNGTTAVPPKPKALQMQDFRVAGAGFEPATFGLWNHEWHHGEDAGRTRVDLKPRDCDTRGAPRA
jgi:hypothetical protein